MKRSNVALSLPKGLKFFPVTPLRVRKPVGGMEFGFFTPFRMTILQNAIALGIKLPAGNLQRFPAGRDAVGWE